MEIARLWRGQEQRYLGPRSTLFEYRLDEGETSLYCRLTGRNVSTASASEFVTDLLQCHFTEKIVARLALELAAATPGLGLEFASKVFEQLGVEFQTEPARIRTMFEMGYLPEDIMSWHFSVDGYAKDAVAANRLASLVTAQA